MDGTPLLDIKPYVPRFDRRDGATRGWLAENLGRLEGARGRRAVFALTARTVVASLLPD